MTKLWAIVNLKRAKLVLAALMVLLPFLTAVPGCPAPEPKPAHLKVNVLPYIGYATFYIPQEEGYFAEQGLEVEFVKLPSGTEAMPLLASGELDVGGSSVNAGLVNAVAQNMNLRIVASRVHFASDCAILALMVRTDLYESGELDSVAEMKGRKVAMSCTACINDFVLTKILEGAGLTCDDVEFIKMKPQDIIAAFENRAIEAAIAHATSLEQIRALGYAVTLESTNNVMPGFQMAFVIFGANLLGDNPELGKKFMVAYLQGVRQYEQGKTKRNLEILEKYTGLDEETLRQVCWDRAYPDGRIITEDILASQDWLYDSGFIDEKVTVEQLIDTRFIEYANQVLGPAP